MHTVIDDHSRVAYAEIHDDETAATAAAVLRNAVAWFADRGVTVERVLSDNGGCYRSHLWRDTCAELGITHKRTRPYRPQTNGKIERFHRTLADGLGVQEALQLRISPASSSASMAPPLQPPPAPHRNRQGITHHQIGQPGWASQLAVREGDPVERDGGVLLGPAPVRHSGRLLLGDVTAPVTTWKLTPEDRTVATSRGGVAQTFRGER